MNKFFNSAACLLCAGFFFACNKSEEPEAPFLMVERSALDQSFTADGGTKEIMVNTNQNVTVTLQPSNAADWCQTNINATSGDGAILTITVVSNSVKEGRTATVTLSAPECKNVAINVVQSGLLGVLELTDFSPKTGGKADTITLTGENFGDIIYNIQVYFNDVEAEVTEAWDTGAKVVVPKVTDAPSCTVKVAVENQEQTHSETFTYEKRWWVDNVKVDVLPSGIAVDDDGENILFLRRFEDARIPAPLGIHRLNIETGAVTHLAGYALVSGEYGFTGIVYDSVSKKFYAIAESTGTALYIIEINPASNWSVNVRQVEAGVNGYWAPGITASGDGKLYSRQWNGSVLKIDPTNWTATTVASVAAHGSKDVSPALVIATGTNNLYIQIRESSELASVNVSTGQVTWLSTSTETGYYDGSFADVRFLRGEQMCSDADGVVYIVDQDNNAIRKITSTGIETVIGGNGSGAVNGLGKNAKFTAPSGLCIDKNGVMYIADTWNASIRKATME
jgi:hypothetical protein